MREVTNAERAEWALEAVAGFAEATRSETARDAISDLIVDLLHLARAYGLDPKHLATQAVSSMVEESSLDDEGDMTRVLARFLELFPSDN